MGDFKKLYEARIAEEKLAEATSNTSSMEELYDGLLKQLGSFIKSEYFKLKKRKITEFKSWSLTPGRYNLIPADQEKSIEDFRKTFPDKKNFTMINDIVELSIDFANSTVKVDFSGFKLDAEYKIPFEIKLDTKKYK